MKRLISEDNIINEERQTKAIITSVYGINEFSSASFRRGVSFAEYELKNLAIAFSYFILDNCCKHSIAYFKFGDKYYSPEQLFEKFIEQRKS